MFGSLGMPELLLILVIALIVFGPKKLPEVGRSLGKAMREFKRTTEDIKGKFEEQLNADEFKDLKSGLDDIKAGIKSAAELPQEIKNLAVMEPSPAAAPPAPPAETASPEPAPAAPAPAGADEASVAATAPAKTEAPATEAATPQAPDSTTPPAPAEVTSQHGEG